MGCAVSQDIRPDRDQPDHAHGAPVQQQRVSAARVGPPVPGTECRLVDPQTGTDAAPGERGEIWVRGPQVMRGYLNNAAATAATIDRAGWLHTGDLGVADEDGWLTIADRVKELIKYKGLQVAPAELEAILNTHPQVADCAVIGVPDDEAGGSAEGVRGPGGRRLRRRRGPRLRRRAGRPVQAHRRPRLCAGDPEVAVGEDPQDACSARSNSDERVVSAGQNYRGWAGRSPRGR